MVKKKKKKIHLPGCFQIKWETPCRSAEESIWRFVFKPRFLGYKGYNSCYAGVALSPLPFTSCFLSLIFNISHDCPGCSGWVSENRSVVFDSLWPHGCSLPGLSVHGILQARILEWVVVPFSRGSSQPRDWTQVSRTAYGFLPTEPPGTPKNTGVGSLSLLQGIFPTQELNRGLLHYRRFLYQLSYEGSPISSLMVVY